MPLAVLLNASAGSLAGETPKIRREDIPSAFESAGLKPAVHYVPGPEIAGAVRQHVEQGFDTIAVGGGDGTLSTAAGVLAGTQVTFVPLPLGTLNHFCKDLGFRNDWHEPIEALRSGRTCRVDVAQVNGRVFLNNCSLGAYPKAVRERDQLRERHGLGKWFAMTLASWNVLRTLRPLRVELLVDGTSHRRRSPLVLVSNNRYGPQLFASSLRERLDAGELWIYTTRATTPGALARLALRAVVGRLDESADFEAVPARQLSLTLSRPELSAGIDGEVVRLQDPLKFEIRHRALIVVAPALPA